MGGMLVGIRMELMRAGGGIESKGKGIMVGREGKKRWKMVDIYVGMEKIEEKLQALKNWVGIGEIEE